MEGEEEEEEKEGEEKEEKKKRDPMYIYRFVTKYPIQITSFCTESKLLSRPLSHARTSINFLANFQPIPAGFVVKAVTSKAIPLLSSNRPT